MGTGAAQMCVPGFSVFIQPYKHAVVVWVILIEQLLLHKRRDHIPVNAPVFGEIGIHPAHSQVRLRQGKGFWLLRLRFLLCNGNDALSVSTQQYGHGFREGLVIELPHEADGVAAPPRSMIIPPVGAYSDAVVAGQPVLPSSLQELFAPVTQKDGRSTSLACRFSADVKYTNLPMHYTSCYMVFSLTWRSCSSSWSSRLCPKATRFSCSRLRRLESIRSAGGMTGILVLNICPI